MDACDISEDIDITDIIPLITLRAIQDARASNSRRGATSVRSSGADYLRELLTCGNNKRIYSVLRMKKDTFERLCQWMRTNGHLKDSRAVLIDQQVAIFLWVVNYSASLPATAERFGLSLKPVHR